MKENWEGKGVFEDKRLVFPGLDRALATQGFPEELSLCLSTYCLFSQGRLKEQKELLRLG